MSSSESFGIVLLEAWLAGKPVVVNKNCAAFHDMAVNGINALMVEDNELAEALKKLVEKPELQAQLGISGKTITAQFDWVVVSKSFVDTCKSLSN